MRIIEEIIFELLQEGKKGYSSGKLSQAKRRNEVKVCKILA